MDNDRYRSTGRRVVNGSTTEPSERHAPSYRQQEEAHQPREDTTQDAPRRPREQAPASGTKKGRSLVWGIIAAVLVLGIFVAWLFWQQQKEAAQTGIDTGRYQAVFLSNGQHYFGKLERMNAEYFRLKDVYYLEQKNGNGESPEATAKQTAVELRKLGEKEVHGPENEMVIAKEHVLLYENLKDKSQVVTLIRQQKQQAE